ncbi:MAG: chemotaxis protein CheV [Chitinophagaceae bacterium]|nr:chemotaxis protein CheV [Oligoflexus sp.]
MVQKSHSSGHPKQGEGYFELIDFNLVRHLPDGREVKGTYGVNVVKVREVIHMPRINPLASTVPGIEGIFELRGVPIPVINLCTILGDVRAPISPEDQIIVTEFAHKRAGFIVHQTNRIRRVPWDKILPPSADKASSMTGMMLIEGNEFLFILDLERIIMQLESMASGRPAFVQENVPLPPMMGPRKLGYPTILLVDDSSLILNSVARSLNQEGYGIVLARNGLEGLQRLEESATSGYTIDAVITDLEMPQMDGLSLLKKIRAHPEFKHIPVYLHTSLSDIGSRETAKLLGANEFFVKNDIGAILRFLKSQLLAERALA